MAEIARAEIVEAIATEKQVVSDLLIAEKSEGIDQMLMAATRRKRLYPACRLMRFERDEFSKALM